MLIKKTPATRPVGQLHILLKERATTVPDFAIAGQRTGAGPAKDGLEKLRVAWQGLSSAGLHLVTFVVDSQRFSDATGWWEGAGDYIERVATMMSDAIRVSPVWADGFKKLPFVPEDLVGRLARVKLLEVLSEMADGFSRKLHNTLLVERADLMRMADVVMTEIELATGRPTLEAGERAMLDDLASIPLNMWQKWLDRLQETQKKNEALRSERQDEIDAANHATAAAEALAKLATGQKVEGDEALRAAKSGSNQRSNQRPKSSVH